MSLPSRAAMTSELKLHLESVQGKAISTIRVSQGEMTVLANRDSIVKLLEFLRDSPTPFHAVANLARLLEARGFKAEDFAKLHPGGAVVDVKSIYDASAVADAGLRLWRL